MSESVHLVAISTNGWFIYWKEQCELGKRRKLVKSSSIGAVIECDSKEDAERLAQYLHDGTFGSIDLEIVEAPRLVLDKGAST